MIVFFSNDEIVEKINSLCEIAGVNQSEFIEQAVLAYFNNEDILRVSEGKFRFTDVQLGSINRLKSTSRVASLMTFLDKMERGDVKEKYKKIISMRFGLFDYKPSTLEEISKEFGVSRERIRQIITKLLVNPKSEDVNSLFDENLKIEDLEYADSFDLIKKAENEIDTEIKNIVKFVALSFAITNEEIMLKVRTKDIALARQVAMYLVKEITNVSLSKIGRFFKKDHTTIIHALQRINEKIKEDPTFAYTIESIREKISPSQHDEVIQTEYPYEEDDAQYDIIFLPKNIETDLNINETALVDLVKSKINALKSAPRNILKLESEIIKTFRNIDLKYSRDIDLLKTRLETLGLSNQLLGTFRRANLLTIGGIVSKNKKEILAIDGISQKDFKEIETILSNLHLSLRG